MNYVKFPRIYHFSDSPGLQHDDRRHEDESVFDGKYVVGTIKMDGECCSSYQDGHTHARSLDSGAHPSREWIRKYMGEKAYQIPENWRICGENLYAKHSIHYKHLLNYFYLYTIFNEKNEVLSWEDTLTWAELLDLTVVPVFYEGIYNRQKIHSAFNYWESTSLDEVEGYVVRIVDSFSFEDFSKYYVKFVRRNHVKTDELWMYQPVIPNELIKKTR
jgi:hypothetical protein